MNIIEKSSNGISQVSADAKLMSNRKVFIEGEINAESACEFVKKNYDFEYAGSKQTD